MHPFSYWKSRQAIRKGMCNVHLIDFCFLHLRETNKSTETLLFGNYEININENYNIFNKVRAYIRQTKRF